MLIVNILGMYTIYSYGSFFSIQGSVAWLEYLFFVWYSHDWIIDGMLRLFTLLG